MPTCAPASADTIERTARALYARRYGRKTLFGKPRRWTSPQAILRRAICRLDAAHLARLHLLNPNPPRLVIETGPSAASKRLALAPAEALLRSAVCAVSQRMRAARELVAHTAPPAHHPHRTPRSTP